MLEIDGRYGGQIKAWVDGVPFERGAEDQAHNVAGLPFVFKHVAVMPDVHAGYGAAVGSVIPTKDAVIPYAVGVDIGCGMMAVRTTLTASQLPDNLSAMRSAIERAVPHGGPGAKGSWQEPGRHGIPNSIMRAWIDSGLEARFKKLCDKHPILENSNNVTQLGSLGGGNHFIEVCIQTDQGTTDPNVWVMLHSGSRGVGNVIGNYFIEKAKNALAKRHVRPQDENLAWLEVGEQDFDDYIEAVGWAQDFARLNRDMMMIRVLKALREFVPAFKTDKEAVNCHHNYVNKERHFGEDIFVTRKGAVSAQKDELGIIPGSMGAKSFIVRGKGHADAFCSCSHGAGRVMSRSAAKKLVSLDEHVAATQGVECRKDEGVIDETPKAYKPIELVMAAQEEMVEIVATLKQVLCVKG
ncbi:tRNA splicing ligase [Caulobacter phage CcrPW]|uniref:3'-phosphate/5'-hydroxy nucleic acid ligase n=1 Tax=Caulobacter phage CcrPW TaxID=2283271 RepID=A0A385ED23_9CAUD|nr:tRNA splicing ligase [Caulobacter phage CcrPW]AXQ68762.1 protein RtcB [Caulobacter phage CcrPW]